MRLAGCSLDGPGSCSHSESFRREEQKSLGQELGQRWSQSLDGVDKHICPDLSELGLRLVQLSL